MTSLWDCSSGTSTDTVVTIFAPLDFNAIPAPPVSGYNNGAVLIHNGADGVLVDPAYPGAGGKTVDSGDLMIFDGTNWLIITTR
jgi:hypothetical protein